MPDYEDQVRAAFPELNDIEDGTYESEYVYSVADILEGYDELKIDVSVTIDGSDVHVDFTGTSDQIPAGINCPYTNIVAVVQYIIRCMTVPDLDGSEGAGERDARRRGSRDRPSRGTRRRSDCPGYPRLCSASLQPTLRL